MGPGCSGRGGLGSAGLTSPSLDDTRHGADRAGCARELVQLRDELVDLRLGCEALRDYSPRDVFEGDGGMSFTSPVVPAGWTTFICKSSSAQLDVAPEGWAVGIAKIFPEVDIFHGHDASGTKGAPHVLQNRGRVPEVLQDESGMNQSEFRFRLIPSDVPEPEFDVAQLERFPFLAGQLEFGLLDISPNDFARLTIGARWNARWHCRRTGRSRNSCGGES